MKWAPREIEALFLDKIDYKGILFYYEDIAEANQEAAKNNKAKK